jgi:hypothetical protein
MEPDRVRRRRHRRRGSSACVLPARGSGATWCGDRAAPRSCSTIPRATRSSCSSPPIDAVSRRASTGRRPPVRAPTPGRTVDDEGRGQPDRPFVRVLGEDAALHQPFARRPRRPGARHEVDPTQSPRPRPGATVGTAASRSAAISHEPSSAERRWYVPSRSMSTTSMPIAHARGLPPNVEPCSPGGTPRGRRDRRRRRTAA